MFKTIIFDLGNVIVNVNYRRLFEEFASSSGRSLEFIESYYNNSPARKSFEKGMIDSQGIYNIFKKDLSLGMTLSKFEKAWCDIFSLNNDVAGLILKLRKRYKLILLSNTDELHFNYIKNRYKIINEFDELILSYEFGYRKPNPMIFFKALIKAKTLPFNCVYVDDISVFVNVAKLMGIKALQYKNFELLMRDLKSLKILSKTL